jgi:hypothetical protein
MNVGLSKTMYSEMNAREKSGAVVGGILSGSTVSSIDEEA